MESPKFMPKISASVTLTSRLKCDTTGNLHLSGTVIFKNQYLIYGLLIAAAVPFQISKLHKNKVLSLPSNTVPLETICAFAAVLPKSNRRFQPQFDRGKTSSAATESRGFT